MLRPSGRILSRWRYQFPENWYRNPDPIGESTRCWRGTILIHVPPLSTQIRAAVATDDELSIGPGQSL